MIKWIKKLLKLVPLVPGSKKREKERQDNVRKWRDEQERRRDS